MLEFLAGVAATIVTLFAFSEIQRRRAAQAAAAQEPATAPHPADAFRESRLRALYVLQQRVVEAPRVSTPEDLLQVGAFGDLVHAMGELGFDDEALLRYAFGEDAVLSWAALGALAQQPKSENVEARLLSHLNGFHPWTRHFVLRLLEQWNPGDPALGCRVLVRLDGSWDSGSNGVVLDDFLRRRMAAGPVTAEGVERPANFDADAIREVLVNQLVPDLAGFWIEAIGIDSENRRGGTGADGRTSGEPGPGDIGRLHAPGGVSDQGLFAYGSADEQLVRLVETLSGTPPRSALIVGETGVGKSSLARRAAAALSGLGWTVFEAGAAQLNAGMSLVGALEERLQKLTRFLAEKDRVVWVIPDFHQLLWSGRHMQSPTGILEMLMPAIEARRIVILGETRPAALERVLQERPEVARVFEIVRLEPPQETEVAALLKAWAESQQRDRGVIAPPAVLAEAAPLARQYLSSRTPPGGVLRLLESAADRAYRRKGTSGAAEITLDDLVEALAQLTGLPLDILDDRRSLDLEAVRRRFESRLIGQPEAVGHLIERLALIKSGITDPTRPYGVYLFAGGSGTGKTELAKTLADYLFGSPERMMRLDMSELQDAHALERVMGAGPDVGTGGNSLAERVRRQPFSVVLLDEFEKAHPRVWDVFLQVFDDGRLTDHRGETTDFRHAIIILTSNLGTAEVGEVRLGLVGRADGFSPTSVERAVARTFRPEFLNRLDGVIVFRPLTRDTMRQILKKELADAFARRGLRRRDWAVELEESAIELLIERGFSTSLGARPLKRALERFLLTPLARAIVDRSAPEGDQFLFVRADGDRLAVEFVDPDAQPATVAPGIAAPGADLATIVYDARGTAAEVAGLRAALEALQSRVQGEAWREAKQALLLEPASPGFWEREDRFERLGRAEYLDRIESGLKSATSLLERLEGGGRERAAYPRDLVRRLAQQLHLLEAACAEALVTGPRDAFVSIEPLHETPEEAGASKAFAERLAAMYEAWARARGMRLADLGSGRATGSNSEPPHVLAIAGFAAYTLLAPDDGLHVLEREAGDGRSIRRAAARVRVAPQPFTPARDGAAGLARQASQALAAHGAPSTLVVRRYREAPSPLVRDSVRGWRTGKIERVMAGDFDVIPAGG